METRLPSSEFRKHLRVGRGGEKKANPYSDLVVLVSASPVSLRAERLEERKGEGPIKGEKS